MSAEHKRAVRRLMAVKSAIAAPYIGILIYGMVILVIKATGLASASSLSFVILAIYAALWSKIKLKLPLFRPLSLEKVMAMEHPAYFQLRQEAARKQREQQERERQVTSHSL